MEKVNIIAINHATHDVVQIKTEKPSEINFTPGQAVDVAINCPDLKNEIRPFTFTSLPSDNFLEFYIKIYPEHHGVTKQIEQLKKGNSLLIGEVFGDINYRNEGIFIAGGAGITPFIAIFKKLQKEDRIGNNKLIFANKTETDIIEYHYFNALLGKNFINVLSEEEKTDFETGYITKDIIKAQINNSQPDFYLCGPPAMMDAVSNQLKELGINDSKIIKEPF